MLPITTDCDFENEAREMIGGWANYSHYKYKIEEDAITLLSGENYVKWA